MNQTITVKKVEEGYRIKQVISVQKLKGYNPYKQPLKSLKTVFSFLCF